MSLGWVYIILMLAITIVMSIVIVRWMNSPADRYDTLLDEMAKRNNALPEKGGDA